MSSTSVTTGTMDEEAFVNAFVSLLTATTTVHHDHDYCVPASDLKSGSSVVLAKMPHPKRKSSGQIGGDANAKAVGSSPEDESRGSITLSFKSIRAPKFSFTIQDRRFTRAETVFAVKSIMVASPEFPRADIDLAQSTIKLLVKGKVIPDDRTLGDLVATDDGADSVSFMVMVSAGGGPSNSPEEPIETPPETPRETVSSADIDDSLWMELEKTIAGRYPLAKAQAITARLRAKWN